VNGGVEGFPMSLGKLRHHALNYPSESVRRAAATGMPRAGTSWLATCLLPDRAIELLLASTVYAS
jgi:hypothetical protein